MPTVLRSTLLAIVALAAAPAHAQDMNPAPPTAKELADGWVMIFDGETTFGWKASEGELVAKDGKLVVGGEKAAVVLTTFPFPRGEVACTFESAGKAPEGKDSRFGNDDKYTGFLVSGKGTYGGVTINVAQPARLKISTPAGEAVRFSRIWFRPSSTEPLFNGKDLTGWKVFADPKRSVSKWEVTTAGELHLTNGPGDLQTARKFDDFVLQLECKTNGPALNSGVFFRCLPDQYQQGYEAQIHNGFKDNDRTKPTDAGTGAVYRRVAARKVVASDNEWFTLTVIAVGPRIATWVNGYQVVDWTDDREPKDNPRQGLRTAAGHISLQGHDKTTDVLFRNVRIAEVKKKD